MDIMHEIYARYRLVGDLRQFKHEDDGTEYYYDQWPNIVFEEGDWHEDFNNHPPNELYEDDDYIHWYRSTHSKPTSLPEAIRNWLDRRQQLARRRECNRTPEHTSATSAIIIEECNPVQMDAIQIYGTMVHYIAFI